MKERILVCGMGVIGSVYALRLVKAGHEVTGLARGERLASLRERGLAVRNELLGDEESAEIRTIDSLPPEAEFDVVIVTVRSGQVLDVLGRLGKIRGAKAMVVIGNNLEDPAAEASLAGENRLVLGFGAFGGYREGGIVHYLDGRTKEKPGLERRSKTTLGILAEAARPALDLAAAVLSDAGMPCAENPDMRAYLRYHAALVFPLAGAMYAAGGDAQRLCRTRDAIVLGIRACRDAFRALRALGFKLQPKSLRGLLVMPEWALVRLLSKSLLSEAARVAMFGHANAPGGRNEIAGQAAVLDELVKQAGTPLEHWNRLLPYFNAKNEDDLIPDGSRNLRLRLW
ncbi:MAG: ketopantoate reductase family protein [Spirochaetales bacterium]|nr:ketopantoate reductase family protein [Spirochaetales bacterium]